MGSKKRRATDLGVEDDAAPVDMSSLMASNAQLKKQVEDLHKLMASHFQEQPCTSAESTVRTVRLPPVEPPVTRSGKTASNVPQQQAKKKGGRPKSKQSVELPADKDLVVPQDDQQDNQEVLDGVDKDASIEESTGRCSSVCQHSGAAGHPESHG